MQVRLVALVPVLGLLLSGCTGGGGTASPSPTLEPLPSPTATALEVPPSAQATTPQGAAAFARFYLQVLGTTFNSGDVQQLRTLSHPECQTCANFITGTLEDAENGESFEGGEYVVASAEASERAPGDAIIELFYTREPSVTRNSRGVEISRSTGEDRTLLQMRTLRQGDSWVVRAIRFPKPPS